MGEEGGDRGRRKVVRNLDLDMHILIYLLDTQVEL